MLQGVRQGIAPQAAAGGRQIDRYRRAQPTGTGDKDSGLLELGLPLFPEPATSIQVTFTPRGSRSPYFFTNSPTAASRSRPTARARPSSHITSTFR